MKRELAAGLACIAAAAGISELDAAIFGSKSGKDVPAVELNRFPARLPTGVSNVLDSIVSVRVDERVRQETPSGTMIVSAGHIASGVRVAPDTYLSAGHAFKNGNNTYLKALDAACESAKVATETRYRYYDRRHHRWRKTGIDAEVPVDRVNASFIDGETTSVPDVALIEGHDRLGLLRHQLAAKVVSHSAYLGDEVYFANYQPTPDKKLRSPFPTDQYYLGPLTQKNLLSPAVYGGVIFGRDLNGDLLVADNLKSYDAIGDKKSIPGASGGGVFSAGGKLIGLSVATSSARRNDLESYYGIHFTSEPKNAVLHFTLVQPVTPDLIHGLETTPAKQLPCAVPENIR